MIPTVTELLRPRLQDFPFAAHFARPHICPDVYRNYKPAHEVINETNNHSHCNLTDSCSLYFHDVAGRFRSTGGERRLDERSVGRAWRRGFRQT
jgi:hypothetical protein